MNNSAVPAALTCQDNQKSCIVIVGCGLSSSRQPWFVDWRFEAFVNFTTAMLLFFSTNEHHILNVEQ